MNEKHRVLLIGSGGREYSTAQAFLQGDNVEELYVAPGNDGMFYGRDHDPRLHRVNLRIRDEDDISKVVKVARELDVDLIFVGPEKPLSLGIVDVFEEEGVAIVGPSRKASRLEGSKAWAKDVMSGLGISVPQYAHFDDPDKAKDYIDAQTKPVVVKADGWAAGKGSIVTETKKAAFDAVDLIMVKRRFGDAGDRVVVEEYVDGDEFSFFAASDGETVLPMVWARDYKRVRDNDQGSNTGGMGAYSPYREEEQDLTKLVMDTIALPLIHGCRDKHNLIYKGILYVGGTFVREGGQIKLYVFEINVRMGDPEAQVIYPRLKTDIVDISMGIIEGNLGQLGKLNWDPNYHVCVCATSGRTRRKGKGWCPGYPGRYHKRKVISGLKDVSDEILVVHSGTVWDPERNVFLTDGGRVLSLVASDRTLGGAKDKVYREMNKVNFEGLHYRTDIGNVDG